MVNPGRSGQACYRLLIFPGNLAEAEREFAGAVGEVEEDREAGEVFEDGAVGGEGGGFIGRGRVGVILNQAGASEPGGADALDGEQRVVERAEAIGKDDGDGEREFAGKVLGKSMSGDDQRRLVESAISELPSAPNGRKGARA